MARLLAILLVLGGLAAFLVIRTQGLDHAFGGALARFGGHGAPAAHASAEPAAPAQHGPDWWERDEHAPPPGIAQGVRERVNRAMDTGARRAAGGGGDE